LGLVLTDKSNNRSPRNLHVKRSRRLEETQSFGINHTQAGWEYCEPHEEVDDSPKLLTRGAKTESDNAAIAYILQNAGDKGASLSDIAAALTSEERSPEAAKKAAQRGLDKLRDAGTAVNRDRQWFKASPQNHEEDGQAF
jgi:hypothetical protein